MKRWGFDVKKMLKGNLRQVSGSGKDSREYLQTFSLTIYLIECSRQAVHVTYADLMKWNFYVGIELLLLLLFS